LNELNSIFNQIDEIVLSPYFWGMIREGLHDIDQYCRKVSMAVLKANLKHLMSAPTFFSSGASPVPKPEFEQLWTTFFDLYDTLESFGSHLTKVRSPPNINCEQIGCVGAIGAFLCLHPFALLFWEST
jgi:hypothetical protein